jgi:DNA-binding NtrC family response regulator
MDYLAKPFAPEELLHAVARCAERHRLLRENAALRSRAGEFSASIRSWANRRRCANCGS